MPYGTLRQAHRTAKGLTNEPECLPDAIVHAPIEHVWPLLAEPANYARWWGAQTQAIVPEEPARPGQMIYARSKAFGKAWDVSLRVEAVDAAKRQLDLTTSLPLGISVHNHIRCTPLDQGMCRIAFG